MRLTPMPKDPFEKWFSEDVAKQLQALKVSPDTFNSNYMLKLRERANWVGCTNELQEFVHKLFKQLRKDGVPMYVHTCYRSPILQAKLKEQGYSSTLDGAHQRSAAVDIVHAYHHWECPDEFWQYVGMTGKRIAKQMGLKIVWGGDETNLFELADGNDPFRWDPAHWEIKEWRQMPRVIALATPLDKAQVLTWSPFSKPKAQQTLKGALNAN